MATLTKKLRARPHVRNPRALARAIGRERHGTGSIARVKARARGMRKRGMRM